MKLTLEFGRLHLNYIINEIYDYFIYFSFYIYKLSNTVYKFAESLLLIVLMAKWSSWKQDKGCDFSKHYSFNILTQYKD